MKLTLDLGGTNIRAAIVENRFVLHKISEPCLAHEAAEVVIGQIESMVGRLLKPNIDGIGIGVPSVVDTRQGIVYNACNIPSWKEVHLKSILENKFGIEVRVNNDCNCFALGEHRYGATKDCDNMVGITLGTGVGAGLILNGRLYCGQLCGAGEVGSIPYLDSDYEHYCSSLWLASAHNMTGAELTEKAAEGDTRAIGIWHEFGKHLGALTKAILYAYSPDAIVVGGGISAAMPYFEEAWRKETDTFPYRPISSTCRLEKAVVDDANLLGAALLFDEE